MVTFKLTWTSLTLTKIVCTYGDDAGHDDSVIPIMLPSLNITLCRCTFFGCVPNNYNIMNSGGFSLFMTHYSYNILCPPINLLIDSLFMTALNIQGLFILCLSHLFFFHIQDDLHVATFKTFVVIRLMTLRKGVVSRS